jgi:peptidoglycan/xylan/chitin deacetylase (PgdA/CDA1 family)
LSTQQRTGLRRSPLVSLFGVLLAASALLTQLAATPALASAGDNVGIWQDPLSRGSLVKGFTLVDSDTTAPTTIATGSDAKWHNKPVKVTFTATDEPGGSGVAFTEYSLSGGAIWTSGTSVTIAAPANHSGDGAYTILYRSTDKAGNQGVPKSVVVKIDTRPAIFRWLSVKPALVVSQRSVTCRYLIGESNGLVRVSTIVYDQYGARVLRRRDLRVKPGARWLNLALRYADRRPFVPGIYRLQFVVTDKAGNRTVSAPWSFRDERPVKAQAWSHVAGAGRRVALTFDDGVSADAWRSMLKTLKAFHVHATFFPLGTYVAHRRALARQTIAYGEAIGSHGWTHADMRGEDFAGVRRELQLSADAWWWAARATPLPFVRPPYGSYDADTLAAVGSLGFGRVMLWDVDPQDWSGIGPGEIAQRVLSHVHPGAIVCMHILPNTAAALPAILRGLRARHYQEVSLPELFRAAGYH